MQIRLIPHYFRIFYDSPGINAGVKGRLNNILGLMLILIFAGTEQRRELLFKSVQRSFSLPENHFMIFI